MLVSDNRAIGRQIRSLVSALAITGKLLGKCVGKNDDENDKNASLKSNPLIKFRCKRQTGFSLSWLIIDGIEHQAELIFLP